MPLEFSLFADDMLIEILGYLPALDIIRFRKVCRRISLASKERSVWINAFSRARCPIPDVNVNTMSTEAIENLLVRMEIMDAKWSGIRPTVPREIGAHSQPPFHQCISMPPYILLKNSYSDYDTYRWYRADNLETLVLEYQHERSISCHATDPSSNTLNIAYMEYPDALGSPDHQEDKRTRLIKIVKFEVSKEQVLSKMERDILWTNFTVPRGISFWLKMLNGYVVGYVSTQVDLTQSWPISLLHIDTGKSLTCPPPYGIQVFEQFIASSTTFSYFIQCSASTILFCKLPSKEEIEASTGPLTLRFTHSGTFPEELSYADLFPRSASTFIVIGNSTYSHGEDEFSRVRFITVNLSQHSPVCDVHEDFCYEARGRHSSYALAQCSPTSQSTLGILTLLAHQPTHTATGIRIARTSTRHLPYYLGLRVDFGVEGYSSPKIDLIELDLVAPSEIEEMALVRDFNPYAGQAILEVRGRKQFEKKLIVTDYVSP